MDLYYYLMNEANIISFEKAVLTISKASSDKSFDNRLKENISELTGLDAKVLLRDSETNKILKTDLIKSFENSKEWQNFAEKVKGSKIVDVVHKEWV
jgi:hypothetical protein